MAEARTYARALDAAFAPPHRAVFSQPASGSGGNVWLLTLEADAPRVVVRAADIAAGELYEAAMDAPAWQRAAAAAGYPLESWDAFLASVADQASADAGVEIAVLPDEAVLWSTTLYVRGAAYVLEGRLARQRNPTVARAVLGEVLHLLLLKMRDAAAAAAVAAAAGKAAVGTAASLAPAGGPASPPAAAAAASEFGAGPRRAPKRPAMAAGQSLLNPHVRRAPVPKKGIHVRRIAAADSTPVAPVSGGKDGGEVNGEAGI